MTAGSTTSAGQTTDEGKGRIFPCDGCGADLKFHIGQQQLKCEFCGYEKEIELSAEAAVEEQDFHAMLARVHELRDRNRETKPSAEKESKEVRCESCGGTVVFTGTLISSECPYCASPIQLEDAYTAQDRIPVDGVLPFLVDRKKAHHNLAGWVKSRWFAPNEFLRRGVQGKFNGVYLPYWTYDSMTGNVYHGQRGEHYWVTVGSGKNQRRVRRTRWYPASGRFQRFFDDVLVIASRGLPLNLVQRLEPWPLHRVAPFNQQMLAGYLARTYEVELDDGFREARQRIEAAVLDEVRRRIGGDVQRVHSVNTHYDAITCKHLLLPTWLLAYRFHDKAYRVMINAGTGEVQGERPFSWLKITLTALAAVAAVGAMLFFINQ
ncbi:MAG: hypothetical protein IID45_03860 [Planctomycetes bacterium]|nr:hypothetical protein [Planctomycetota bacterium]